MKQTINFNDFRQAFIDYDRTENFSDEGLELLFNWLIDIEEDTGEEMELDVIALCCDFCESSFNDIGMDYDIDLAGMDADERMGTIEDYLSNNTVLIGETPTGLIYQQF